MESVSVIIPCYGAEEFIGETLCSVLRQTHPPIEVLVIDDGSFDQSAQIAANFGPPIRVIRQHNQGESIARNRGIEEARGEWVAFLDADDLWEPEKLAVQLEHAKRTDAICIATDRYTFGPGAVGNGEAPAAEQPQLLLESLIVEPLVHISTALVRRSTPVRFPTWTRYGEDMIYFAELSLHGEIVKVPQPLTGYRLHPASQTRSAQEYRIGHFQSRYQWVDTVQDIIGHGRAEGVREGLRTQLVEWIKGARWKRDWEGYAKLRAYAAELEWGSARPSVLDERPWPRWVYELADTVRRSPRPAQQELAQQGKVQG